jgi:putative membrane protein
VKEYGAMLVREHSEANSKAQAVAKKINLDPPTGADIGHQATYLKLKVLSGDTFDSSFIRGMVKDHEKDVAEFTKQSAKKDAAGQHAKEILPKLQAHLSEAKAIQSQLKKKKQ